MPNSLQLSIEIQEQGRAREIERRWPGRVGGVGGGVRVAGEAKGVGGGGEGGSGGGGSMPSRKVVNILAWCHKRQITRSSGRGTGSVQGVLPQRGREVHGRNGKRTAKTTLFFFGRVEAAQ